MFVTTNYKIGFIHIPKCGGTSIYHAFRGGLHGPNKRNNKDPWSPWPVMQPHSTYKEFKAESTFPGPETWFTIVRHPCQRFHSWYHYQIAWDKKRLNGQLPLKGLEPETFEQRIKTLEELGLKGTLQNLDTLKNDTGIKLARHVEYPMYNWIANCKNIKVFKLEKIGALYDWFDEIGCTVEFTHSKKTPRRSTWQDEFDDEMIELISKRYAKDFTKFGYSLLQS
jgi:hypothetical protein